MIGTLAAGLGTDLPAGTFAAALPPLAAAAVPPVGGYFSILKIVVMLVLAAPWLAAAPWVHRDAKRVGGSQGLWSALVLGCGGVGLLIWLLVPYYIVGLLLYVVLAAGTLGAYVAYRNPKVDPKQRVLTSAHFASLFRGRKKKQEELAVLAKVKLYDAHTKVVLPPEAYRSTEQEIHTYNLVQDLLHDVIWRRASEAELVPAGEMARARYVIDGVPVNGPTMPLAESEAIIQYLKGPAGMDVAERRRPQEGRISVDLAEGHTDVAVSTAGTTGGQRMLFRVVAEVVKTDIEKLGMSDDVLARVRELNKARHGLILVSAKPRNGLTSTLYALLRDHDVFIQQVVTLEAEPVVDLENVTQRAYGQPAALPETLAAALRRDPDVVMVDQCLDAQSAELITEAADRKLLLVGMPAPDSFTALAKWIKVRGDTAAAVRPLRAVLCQVLLRTLCMGCKEAYTPDPQLLAKANIPAGAVERFYRPPTAPLTDPKGHPIVCPSCQGTGYRGRTAAFELLEVTDEVRQLVLGQASLGQIKAACRKSRMLYLQEQALRKVIQGVTSVQEVIRVSQQAKK